MYNVYIYTEYIIYNIYINIYRITNGVGVSKDNARHYNYICIMLYSLQSIFIQQHFIYPSEQPREIGTIMLLFYKWGNCG